MDGGSFHDPTAFTPLHLPTRHKLAKAEIASAAKRHIMMDVALGGLGSLIPVPGAAVVALGASMAAQGPTIYFPLLAQLGEIYTAPPDRLSDFQRNHLPMQLVWNSGVDITAEFTTEFLLSASYDTIAAALGVMWVPVIGSLVGAYLDYRIAKTMTARIGRMAAIFYLNGNRWKNGSFKDTYEEAKREGKGDLGNIPDKNPDVRKAMIGKLVMLIKVVSAHMNRDQITSMFRAQQVSDDLISDALREAGL